ncbi:ead/Ea22-like family protein [Salmonella enterica]|nr:ead/Ea22-like family protein [Salmonella enterica]ECM4407334.1 ead/Ea22-like family protein [Salmonella enterica subsp. enterica serovar Give]EBT3692440.1 ead/Ea22-like family protein [Salmonella enterica]ECZ7410644.1 ead/Ea22-like family protein [Salmonella enterica]EDC5065501.1 ead/Ea22-like family protein [Salmonella enterica]
MTIDKQALRETAEKALPAMQRLLMMPNDELFDEAALNVDGDVDAANAFNLLAGPETMLALLDENLQLQREKDAIEAVALALRDDMRQAREQLEAGWKQNATDVQIKARLCRESNSLHDRLREAEKRIAELEAKLETADKLQDSAFRDGLKAGFSYGQTDDQSGFAQCMSAYSTRTGIKVKE